MRMKKYIYIYTFFENKKIYIYIFFFFSGCCPGIRAEFSCVPFLAHGNTHFNFFKDVGEQAGENAACFFLKNILGSTLAFPDLSDKQEHVLFGFQFWGDKQEEMLPVFLKFFSGPFSSNVRVANRRKCCPSFWSTLFFPKFGWQTRGNAARFSQ